MSHGNQHLSLETCSTLFEETQIHHGSRLASFLHRHSGLPQDSYVASASFLKLQSYAVFSTGVIPIATQFVRVPYQNLIQSALNCVGPNVVTQSYSIMFVIPLFTSITTFCGNNNNMRNISSFILNVKNIFCRILSLPHDIVMDLNDVMVVLILISLHRSLVSYT